MILTKKKFGVVALVAALGALMVSAQLSSATHVRPKGATPLYVPLVIAYKQCNTYGAPNSTHNGGVPGPSCAPPLGPQQESQFLWVGTPDTPGNLSAANSIGFIRLVVKTTSPEDVLITSSATDIRCKPATSAASLPTPIWTRLLHTRVPIRGSFPLPSSAGVARRLSSH